MGVAAPLVAFSLPRLSHRPSLELAVGLIDVWADALAALGVEVACDTKVKEARDPRLGFDPDTAQMYPEGTRPRAAPDLFVLSEVCPRRGGFRGTLSVREGVTLFQRRWLSFRGGAWAVVDYAESGLVVVAQAVEVECEPAFRTWLGVRNPREAVTHLRRVGARGIMRRRARARPALGPKPERVEPTGAFLLR